MSMGNAIKPAGTKRKTRRARRYMAPVVLAGSSGRSGPTFRRLQQLVL